MRVPAASSLAAKVLAVLSAAMAAGLVSAAVAQETGSDATSDTARIGKRLVTTCKACHSLDADGSQSNAPTLYGLFGRKAGSSPGFDYSAAMKNASIIWSGDTLDGFLKNPQAAVPGTKMGYAGLPDDTERKALIEYLRKQTSPP